MRAFCLGVAVAAIFAIVSAIGLNFVQKSAADAYKSGEARLNNQEIVNNYGRQG